MSRSLKILYCTDQLYKHGGIERVTTTKLNGWVEKTNNSLHLVTTEQKGNPFCYELDNRVNIYDLQVNYNREISYFKISNLKKTLIYIDRLRKLIQSLKPDVVVCVNSGPINLFLPYVAKNSVTINEFHSSRMNRYNFKKTKKALNYKRLTNYFASLAEKNFTRCIVLNKTEINYFLSKNVSVIPNPINISKYKENNREKIVVAAGRIAQVKGYDLLIKAWQKVNKIHPDWKLKIYGDGDDNLKKDLNKIINNLELQNSISLCGSTSRLHKIFLKSSIHALSSHEESFGMVILEAQAYNLPTVAFNCPTGPKELILNNESGFLIKPNDINGFASKINYLIENPEIRKKMGKNAILNARMYDISIIIEKWNTLFNDLVNQKY